MSNLFVLPKQTPITPAGSIYAGAKAYFFETGTSTPKNTYSDAALSTPHANPVVADAAGMFPAIYLDTEDGEYRLTLRTSAEVLLYTQDNVGNALNLTQAIVGELLYPRTAAEIAASVTPTNYQYPELHLLRYGTNTTPGTTDMQPAMARALSVIAQKNAGGELIIPDGLFFLADTVNVVSHRTHIRGAGKHATTLTFNPSTAKPCLKLRRTNTAEILAQPSICGLTLSGSGANQKIGIDAWDTSELVIEDVTITGFTGASSSIGIRTQGREFTRLDRVTISADFGIHIVENPNSPTLSADHFSFREVYVLPQLSTGSSILIDGDVGLATLNIDGLSCVGGKWGINWLSGTVPSTALGVRIANMRFEQPADNTGYAIEWNGATNDLLLENVNYGGVGSPTNGGLKVRNTTNITQENCLYTGGGVALNIDTTCDNYYHISTLFQGGSTVSMTGFEEVFSFNSVDGTAPLRPTTYWYRTASGIKSLRVNGSNFDQITGQLAAGATVALPVSASGSLVAGSVDVSIYSATGPLTDGGLWDITTAGAQARVIGANMGTGNAASKFCLHQSSTSSILLRNNLAVTVEYIAQTKWRT